MNNKYATVVAVAAFIFDNQNRLLIVKKSAAEKIDAGLWTVPGGKAESTEPSVDALIRETKEEVNFDIKSYRWSGEDVFKNKDVYYHSFHFLCSVKNTKNIKLERSLLQYHWLKKNEIENFQFHPNIKKRILFLFTHSHQPSLRPD